MKLLNKYKKLKPKDQVKFDIQYQEHHSADSVNFKKRTDFIKKLKKIKDENGKPYFTQKYLNFVLK